jgi:hypothetical protein
MLTGTLMFCAFWSSRTLFARGGERGKRGSALPFQGSRPAPSNLISLHVPKSVGLFSSVPCCSALKKEAVRASETPVHEHHISKCNTLYSDRPENLKAHVSFQFVMKLEGTDTPLRYETSTSSGHILINYFASNHFNIIVISILCMYFLIYFSVQVFETKYYMRFLFITTMLHVLPIIFVER